LRVNYTFKSPANLQFVTQILKQTKMAFTGKEWMHENAAIIILVWMVFGLQHPTCLGEKSSSYKASV